MIMADVFKILFLVLGGLIIVNAYWLLTEALATNAVRRARDLYTNRPFRTMLVGVAAGGPATFLGIVLLSSGGGVPSFAGFTVLSVLVLIALFGSTGFIRLVGEGLPAERDAREPWRAVMRGGSVVSIACLLPIAGWFIVLPITLASGVGAVICVMMPIGSRKPAPESVSGVHA